MIKSILITEFSNFFDKQLAEELLEDYQKLKEAEIQRKYDYAGQLAGKYFETVVKIIINIKFKKAPNHKGIKFEDEFHKILKEPKKNIEDETLCLVIPLVLKGGYTLRNKKRISHARGINPEYMDCRLLCTIADWVMAELLRIFHVKENHEIEDIINKIISKKIPLIQIISNEIVILEKEISAALATMLVLYLNEGTSTQDVIINELSKYYSSSNIKVSIGNNIRLRKIHKDNEGNIHLTELGYEVVNKHLQNKLIH